MRKRSEVTSSTAARVSPPTDTRVSVETRTPTKTETVEELSARLTRELDSERFGFESAHKQVASPIRSDIARIVEEIFVDDLHACWSELRKKLKADTRSDHGSLHRAVEEASDDAYEAHRLYVTARVARSDWEKDNEKIHGAMWSAATRSIQAEKDQKLRNKQITDADIKARCATLFPDEWKTQEKLRDRVKAVEDSLSQLADIYMGRVMAMSAILKKLR